MPLPKRIRSSVSRQAKNVLVTGQRFKHFDQLRQRHFWSTHIFTPDSNGYIRSGSFPLFVTPSGQSGQGFPAGSVLSERDTNWPQANPIPDNQNFEVNELGVTLGPVPNLKGLGDGNAQLSHEPLPGNIANCFLHNTVLSIKYLTNEVELGLVQDFGQAAGPMMGLYQARNGLPGGEVNEIPSTRYLTNGFAGPALRRRFKIPILLQHGETFSFLFIIPRSFHIGATDAAERQRAIYARLDFFATESFVEKS